MKSVNKFSPEARCGPSLNLSPPQDRLRAPDLQLTHRARLARDRRRKGITTSERAQMKELESEVKELRKANEVLKLTSSFFAQAQPDRRLKF